MKFILIAAALAVAAVPMASVAQAASASVTVKTDADRYHHEHHDNGLHRGWVVGKHKGWAKHEARERCMVKKVKTYHDHRVVIRTKRVCD